MSKNLHKKYQYGSRAYNKQQAINKLVKMSEADRLELLGYLMAQSSDVVDMIMDFNPTPY